MDSIPCSKPLGDAIREGWSGCLYRYEQASSMAYYFAVERTIARCIIVSGVTQGQAAGIELNRGVDEARDFEKFKTVAVKPILGESSERG